MIPVDDHSSTWASAILLSQVSQPLSALAACAKHTYGATSIATARPCATSDKVRQLEAMITTEDRRVRTPDEAKQSTIPTLLELIDSNTINSGSLDRVMQALVGNRQLMSVLAGMDSANELVSILRRHRQLQGLDELKSAIEVPETSVATLRELLWREWWVFGGTLIPWLGREFIADLDQDVIPLIRLDAAVHLIIVGSHCIPDLAAKVGDMYVLSPHISSAFDRARYLIRRMDDHRKEVSERLHINCGRAIVTVVIGHPMHADADADVAQEEIRVLNTFFASINVMTYEELINIADQALDVGGTT